MNCFRDLVNGLSYTLDIDNNLVQSWQTDPLPEDQVAVAVTNDLGSMFEIYTNATHLLETYYIKGQPSTVSAQKGEITNAITAAYATANNGKTHNIVFPGTGALL